MFDEPSSTGGLFEEDDVFDLVQELSANTPEELRRKRAHFRMAIRVEVTAQPGNASDLDRFQVRGMTGDISQGGLSAIFPRPVRVGDVYRLQFDRRRLDVPLTFARCVRCRLIREDAFEAGFAFFSEICLPENVTREGEPV
ncbi:MAG: PilZ domain-containing protein [Planctomycetota bacterium]|nr:MAG: PilZ domain-containing protein [Planctomycetota bacterium]